MADSQNKQNEEVFEEGEPKEARTVHRMRANSTIMQVNKILVANRGEIRESKPMHFPRTIIHFDT